MADPFGALKGYVDQKISSIESRLSEVLYGTVTQIEPSLTVRLSDGTLLTDTQSLEPILRPGDPVRLAKHGGFLKGSRVVILGKVSTLPFRIPTGADFNSYTTPGTYYNPLTAEVTAMPNKPPSGQAGALEVLESAGTIQLWREYNIGGQGRTWRRRFYSGAWSDWWVDSDPEWGRWKVYSPAMSHAGYNGGATLTGRYTTFRDTMQGTITVKVTSPAHMGTGAWLISLPQPARAYNLVTGVGHYYIGSAAWVVSVQGAGTGIIGVLAAGAGRISASNPGAVGTTTELTISFQAELSGAP